MPHTTSTLFVAVTNDPLPTYMLVFAVALGCVLAATPLVRRLALKLQMVDQPNYRKMHVNPTPLLGGVAIYCAFLLGLTAVYILIFGKSIPSPQLLQIPGILAAVTITALFGLWDDHRGLRPLMKIVGQLLAAFILISVGVNWSFHHSVLNIPLTILWVLFISNAFNLLDNMDGLSAGVAGMGAAFFFMLAYFNGQFLVGFLAVSLLAACLGFLYYNFNPFQQRKIFMGDAGSLFLGTMLAILAMKIRISGANINTIAFPLIILGVPIFDTSLVIVARVRRGVNPLTTPGKDHFSHRLVQMGFTPREAVLILYLLAGAAGFVGLVLWRAQTSLVETWGIVGLVVLAGASLLVTLLVVDGKGRLVIETPTTGVLPPAPPDMPMIIPAQSEPAMSEVIAPQHTKSADKLKG